MTLYHYCSNEALKSILTTRQIWLSDLTLSNDPMEGQWIKHIFELCCIERNVRVDRREKLLEQMEGLLESFGAGGFCLSENGDLLSQWRAYSTNGGGVAIGFNEDYFKVLGERRRDRSDDFSAHLVKVEYDVDRQKSLIAERLEPILKLVDDGALDPLSLLAAAADEDGSDGASQKRLKKIGKIVQHFLFYLFHVFELKNPGFSEEREWRLLSLLFRFQKNDIGALEKLGYRALGDRIISYVPIDLEPLEMPCITEVVVGPRNLTPNSIIERLLASSKWEGVRIKRSKVTYRQ